MITLPAPDVYGFTIFCDDIRQEIGGKVSFIGTYSAGIFVHGGFPCTLAKFAFATTLLQRREVLEPNVEIQIFLPGDDEDTPSFRTHVTESVEGTVAAQTAAEVAGLPRADDSFISLSAAVITAPLVIKEPGIIKVRALRRGELVRLGAIRIMPAPTT
jgi:hypothetical protein